MESYLKQYSKTLFQILFSLSHFQITFSFSGDTIKFVCEDGYSLNSEIETHTCRENGTWDQEVQPTCVLSGTDRIFVQNRC